MIDKILKSFFWKRHRFRHMTFDELSELYSSMMLRSLAMSMAGIFIPIYLYQHGYEVWRILFFYALVFSAQFIFVKPVAYLIALVGPKHTILISYLLQVISMTGLIYIQYLPSYLMIAFVFGLSNIAFFIAFNVGFSKVKHSSTAGKEVGWSYVMERSGAVLGPVVGGLVAFVFAPQYTFAVSIIILLLAAVPLFLTKEPVQTRQKLNFTKLKVSKVKRDAISYSALGVETTVSMVVWPLFLGVIVFRDNPYVQLGLITSISIAVSFVAAQAIGRIVDNKRGRPLLRFNAVVNAVLHLFRPFTLGFATALAVNLVNDGVTPGYRMPYLKGMYDAADDHPGFRIVYMATLELFSTLSRAMFFVVAAFAAYSVQTDRLFFAGLFTIGALASLLIMTERYKALNAGRG